MLIHSQNLIITPYEYLSFTVPVRSSPFAICHFPSAIFPMSTWHDIFTVRPPDAALIQVRRSIFDTPNVFGTWDATNAVLHCGVGS